MFVIFSVKKCVKYRKLLQINYQHLVNIFLTESITEYFVKVLAGLAGSLRMISATILTLSRLVYEFHGMHVH